MPKNVQIKLLGVCQAETRCFYGYLHCPPIGSCQINFGRIHTLHTKLLLNPLLSQKVCGIHELQASMHCNSLQVRLAGFCAATPPSGAPPETPSKNNSRRCDYICYGICPPCIVALYIWMSGKKVLDGTPAYSRKTRTELSSVQLALPPAEQAFYQQNASSSTFFVNDWSCRQGGEPKICMLLASMSRYLKQGTA